MEPYVEVECKKCHIKYDKSKRSLKRWSGLCRKCASIKRETSHGMSRTRLYHVWQCMKDRCINPLNHGYEGYGGRGINICNEWKDAPEHFLEWSLENGYNDELSIDRIDNNKGYYPDNCRWTNRSVQQQNKNKSKNTKNKYIGVQETPYRKFQSTVFLDGVYIFRRNFESEIEALQARNQFIVDNNLNHTIQKEQIHDT